jgi:hypothetical protein
MSASPPESILAGHAGHMVRTSLSQSSSSFSVFVVDDITAENGKLRSAVSTLLNQTANARVVPRFRWFTLLDYDDVLAERLVNFARKLDAIPAATARIRSVV